MAEPFSKVRARINVEGTLIIGVFDDAKRLFIKSDADGKVYGVNPREATFNTGLLDHNGKEIFTGDKLRHFNDPYKQSIIKEAEFMINLGGFCMRYKLNSAFFRNNHAVCNEYPDWVEQTQTVHENLNENTARQYVIVGNIYSPKIEPLPKDEVFDRGE